MEYDEGISFETEEDSISDDAEVDGAELLDDGDVHAEDDFGFTSTSRTSPVVGEEIARAHALVRTMDDSIRHASETLQIIISTRGDTDEQLGRWCQDILQTWGRFGLEFKKHPGRIIARIIRAEKNPEKRSEMITNVIETMNTLRDVLAREE